MIGPLVLFLATTPLPSAEAPVAKLAEARDLLLSRKFAALTSLVEAGQGAARNNPGRADELDWTLNAFRLTFGAIPPLIDEWAVASPNSWAPLLARAINSGERARSARGERSASKTDADQFRRMDELNALMSADCRKALARNAALCPCYVELVLAAKQGNAAPEPLIEKGFRECPRDYSLRVERVHGLTPRWGGSYAQMQSAIDSARQAGLDEGHVKSLESYVPIDQASVLEINGRADEARAILDRAIKASPTAILLDERAELSARRGDAPGALEDANAALKMTNGGWMFSPGRLTRLLLVRIWALVSVGRASEAQIDMGLALEISPTDGEVRQMQASLSRLPRTPKD